MIKQISIDALQVGMYIDNINCGWLEHPFARNRFLIQSANQLHKLRQLPIATLYIDTERGLDAPPAANRANPAAQPPAANAAPEAAITIPLDAPGERTPFEQELITAQQISREAQQLISELMNGVKLGQRVRVDAAEELVEQMTHSLIRNPDALLALGRIRSSDRYTFEHSVNVCTLMVAFGHYLGLDHRTIRALGTGAVLHDMGKICVDERILNKPGPLSDDEFKLMQRHVNHGHELLRTAGIDEVALALVSEHHERFDGSGYPRGLHGEQISQPGHMGAIVDVYDALSSDRCYHRAMEPTQALRKLYGWSQQLFHPQLTQQFIRFIGVYPAGAVVTLASGHLALVLERNDDRLQPRVRLFYDTLRQRAIEPYDLDLSQHSDHIHSYADLAAWNLNLQQVLGQLL